MRRQRSGGRTRSDRLTPLDPRLLRAAPALRRHLAVLTPLLAVRAVLTVAAAVLLAQSLALVWHGHAGLRHHLLLLAGVVAARAVLDGVVDLLGSRARDRVRGQLRAAALRGLRLAGPSAARDAARTGHAVGPALDTLDGYVVRVVPALLQGVVVPPVVLLAMGRTDLLSAGLLVATLPLVPLFLALLGLTTRDRTQRSYETLAALAARLLDLLQGLPTLKLHGRAQGQVDAVARVAERHRRETMGALRWAFVSGLALDLVATLSVALVAVAAGLRLDSGRLALEPALVVLLLAPEVFAPLRAVGTQYHASTDALEAAAAALELAATPTQEQRSTVLSGEPVATLVDVTVRHPGRDDDALHDVTLTLRPGEVVAVEGPSGAGKSTMLQVLIGGVAPTEGTVVTGSGDDAWRSRLAWVPQRPRPTRATVAEEVRLGDPGADDTAVAAALDVCDALPPSTALGEGGRSVSAGQRRRVALARAVLRARAVAARGEHPLVLLDEPSEDLDDTGEAVVARLVHALRGTAAVVVVTHSPALAAHADRRVRVEAGRVVADAPCVPAPAPADVPRSADPPQAVAGPPAEPELGWRDVARAFRPDVRGLLPRTAVAVAVGAGAALVALALAATSTWLVLRAADQPGVQALGVAVVGVRAFALGKAFLRYAERLAAHDVALRLLARTRVRVVQALVPLAPTGLDLWRRGDVLRRFTADVDAVQDVVVRGLLPVAGAAVSALGALALTAALAPAAVLPLGAGLLATAACAPVAALLGRRGTAAAGAAAGRRDRLAVGWVEALPELWVHGADSAEAAAVAAADVDVARAGRAQRWVSAVATAVGAATGALTPLLALNAAAGTVSGRTAGVVAVAAVAAVEPVAALAPAWAAIGSAAARARRVVALLQTTPPVSEPAAPAPVPAGDLAVVADDAALAHRGAAPVLRALDLTVAPGTRTAVLGPSGCGKSTLVAALLRLLTPSAGAVGVAAAGRTVPLTSLAAADAPAVVTGCLQDDHLFDATLRENLRIGRPGASDDDLDVVADRLGLLPWVRSLPDGWATRAGADGVRVSGGQRQRLLLARALLADAPVLVLDEPTAHLDPDTEQVVVADLLRATRGRTVLLSTHRRAGLDQLDAVLRVRDGRLQAEDLVHAARLAGE